MKFPELVGLLLTEAAEAIGVIDLETELSSQKLLQIRTEIVLALGCEISDALDREQGSEPL